jgi:hypothetical protein
MGEFKDNVKDILCMRDRPGTLEEYRAMAIEIDNGLYARRLEKRAQKSIHS